MMPSFRWFGATDPIPLAYIRQIPGVMGVVSALYDVPVGDAWGRARLGTLKAQIEDAGLCFAVVESIPVHEDIKLGRPARDRLIDRYSASIASMAPSAAALPINSCACRTSGSTSGRGSRSRHSASR